MTFVKPLLFIAIIMGCVQAYAFDALPVTPSEKRFYEFLEDLTQVNFGRPYLADPWIQCDNEDEGRTFFSASLSKYNTHQYSVPQIQSWIGAFLDHAYWSRVSSATCRYDISNFNECFAKGSFSVYIKRKHIVSFRIDDQREFCEEHP